MTNQEMLAIFNTGNVESFMAGLRAVWNAGWYQGNGTTPTASSPDKSGVGMSKPVAVTTKAKK